MGFCWSGFSVLESRAAPCVVTVERIAGITSAIQLDSALTLRENRRRCVSPRRRPGNPPTRSGAHLEGQKGQPSALPVDTAGDSYGGGWPRTGQGLPEPLLGSIRPAPPSQTQGTTGTSGDLDSSGLPAHRTTSQGRLERRQNLPRGGRRTPTRPGWEVRVAAGTCPTPN